MSITTTTNQGFRRRGRHSRGNPPRRPPRPDTRQRGPGQTRTVQFDEALPLLSDDTADADSYKATFRRVLEATLEEVPADRRGVMSAYARAASRTWDTTTLHPERAEEVRLGVLAELCQERGLDRMRCGGAPASDWVRLSSAGDVAFPLPRDRAVPGEHPRRSGKRKR